MDGAFEDDDDELIVTRPLRFDEEMYQKGRRNLPRAIDEYGFTSLRPGQEKIVKPILGCTDTICILPTGGGKTACFVIPAMAHGWRLLVFSPLRALMKDQIEGLNERGIVAMSLSSDNSDAKNAEAIRGWISGECKILLVAPERLFNDNFMAAIRKAPPQMIAVDEAHVLEAWGDNFRSSYNRIGDLIDWINPQVIVALTATSSPEVERAVRRVFRMENAIKIDHYVRRDNLKLSSGEFTDLYDVTDKIEEIDGKVLVYCGTRAKCNVYACEIGEILGEPVGVYHAGVEKKAKELAQKAFKEGVTRVMCATNAFGMGVDIPDIRGVIHVVHPIDPEALSQEIGRAGRDGKESWCHTFHSKYALRLNRRFLSMGHPLEEEIRRVADLFEDKCDTARVVKLPKILIARMAAVPFGCVDSIQQILMSSGVTEPVKDGRNVKWVSVIEDDLIPSEEFDLFMMQVADATLDKDDEGYIAYDASIVAARLGIGLRVLNDRLFNWSKEKIISSLSAGEPRRIIGDVSMIDFPRLAVKRDRAYEKLEYVRGYFKVPDDRKHSYLEDYFKSCSEGP